MSNKTWKITSKDRIGQRFEDFVEAENLDYAIAQVKAKRADVICTSSQVVDNPPHEE